MSDITIKKMKLAELKAVLTEKILSIKGKLRQVADMLALASISKIEDINIQAAFEIMRDAAHLHLDYMNLLDQIRTLEGELS